MKIQDLIEPYELHSTPHFMKKKTKQWFQNVSIMYNYKNRVRSRNDIRVSFFFNHIQWTILKRILTDFRPKRHDFSKRVWGLNLKKKKKIIKLSKKVRKFWMTTNNREYSIFQIIDLFHFIKIYYAIVRYSSTFFYKTKHDVWSS